MSEAPIFDPSSGRPVGDAGASASAIGAAVSSSASAAPPPDFTPMSLDDARLLLVREHKVAVGDDDPMLMMVTLHQGMCADLDRLLSVRLGQFAAQIDTLLRTTGNGYAEVVEQTLESLKDKTVKASLDQAFALNEKQALAIDALRRRLRRHGIVIGLLSLLSVASCGVVFAIVSRVIQ